MITQLTFMQPTISASSLAEEADHFMASFHSQEDTTFLDSQKDTRKVIYLQILFSNDGKNISLYVDDWGDAVCSR